MMTDPQPTDPHAIESPSSDPLLADLNDHNPTDSPLQAVVIFNFLRAIAKTTKKRMFFLAMINSDGALYIN